MLESNLSIKMYLVFNNFLLYFTRSAVFKDHVKCESFLLLADYRSVFPHVVLQFYKTGMCSCKDMKHLKLSVTKKKELPVLFSEARESAEIGLYSLSCFPRYHSIDKNMVYHSCTHFIWNHCCYSSSPFSASSSLYTTSYMHSPSSQTVSTHIWYQPSTPPCCLCTLNWFMLVSSHPQQQVRTALSSCV